MNYNWRQNSSKTTRTYKHSKTCTGSICWIWKNKSEGRARLTLWIVGDNTKFDRNLFKFSTVHSGAELCNYYILYDFATSDIISWSWEICKSCSAKFGWKLIIFQFWNFKKYRPSNITKKWTQSKLPFSSTTSTNYLKVGLSFLHLYYGI